MNTNPEPEPYVLDDVDSVAALTKQLNEQADESRLVLSFDYSVEGDAEGDAEGDGVNKIIYAFENSDDIRGLGKLSVEPIPSGATAAEANRADTPEAKKSAKDAYLKFVSPFLENHVALCRAEIFIKKKKVEVVLLREAEPYQPPSLNGKILKGGPGWEWLVAEIVGDDIVVRGANATAFGGTNDSLDSGMTASGSSTAGRPDLIGCALALGGYATSQADLAALGGTPLPKMPFGLDRHGNDRPEGAHVEITDPRSGKKINIAVPVIDLGPAKWTKHALDLSVAAARQFMPGATANNFSMVLDYRIIRGALALPAEQRTPAPLTVNNAPPAGNNKLIYESARKSAGVLSTAKAPGTEGGNLACAWVVNEVVKKALGHPIGGDTSTADMHRALKGGKGSEVPENQATPGAIIISPTVSETNHGHVGILGEAGCIYSNSSAHAKFEQNFRLEGWKAYYQNRKGLKVLFYNVV